MRSHKFSGYRQSFAFVTMLSVVLTQVAPVWALRPGQTSEAPGVLAGLEEALRTIAAPFTGTGSLKNVVGRFSADPIWSETMPGWNPQSPLDNEAEAVRRLELLFSKYGKEVSNTKMWDQIMAALLAPGNPAVQQAVAGADMGDPQCVSCAAYVTRNHQGSSLAMDPAGLVFDQSYMAARHAVHTGSVRPLGPDGSAQLDLNEIASMGAARGGASQGVVFSDTGAAVFRQAIDLIRQNQGKVQAVTVAVERNIDNEAHPHFVTLAIDGTGRISLLDRDRVFSVNATPTEISFVGEDNRTFSISEFVRSNQPVQTALVWTSLNDSALAKILPGRARLADAEALEQIVGCCGVNSVFGQYGGIRAILDAVLRLKYRAPDNTGLLVWTEEGPRVVKAGMDIQGQGDGEPGTLIQYLYNYPIYPETFPHADKTMSGNPYQPQHDLLQQIQESINRGRLVWARSRQQGISPQQKEQYRQEAAGAWSEARRREREWLLPSAVHEARLQGFKLLSEEGLMEFVPTSEQIGTGRWPLYDLTRTTLGDLFEGRASVQVGRVGGVWAGDQVLIRHNDLPDLVREIGRLFDLTPEFVQLFLRAELSHALQEAKGLIPGKTQEIMRVYDLLSSRALSGQLTPKEHERWDEVMDFLVGRWLVVPPDYNVDPTRHVFRMQGGLIGLFQAHPEWLSEVKRRFEERVPGRGKNWFDFWKRERNLNMPGHAFAALVDWFHDWAHTQKVDIVENGQVIQAPLLPDKVYQRILQIRQQQVDTGVSNPTQPQRGTYRRGYSLGAVTEFTVRLLGEMVVGHGRWAMTGDPSRWNAHPHNTKSRVVVHNGQVKGTINSALRKEHMEAFQQSGPEAQYFKDFEGYYWAEETTPTGTKARYSIVTDTRTIVVHWDYVAKQFEMDKAAGRVEADGLMVKLNLLGQLNQDRNEFNRAQVWNRVVENLRAQGRREINPDEVAFRVATLEMEDGSELGVNATSLHSPLMTYVVSHDRPVDIVMVGERILVTSDYAAGIALFPAPEVAEAARKLSEMQQQLLKTLEHLRELRQLPPSQGGINAQQYAQEVTHALREYEQRADPIRKQYKVDVYHLKELNKFARVTRRLDEQGAARLNVDVTHLDGSPLTEKELTKEAKKVEETVSPELGVKGIYRTFMEMHIDEIPKILLDQAVSYMAFNQQGQPVSVNIPTLNAGYLRDRFGQKLENLRRIFLIGVGSSWRDAMVAEQLFRELLPGVEILVYDPVDIQNRGIKLNPKTDLAVGMSWSGSTASTVKLFNRFSSEGVSMMSVTGKTGSDMGRLSKESAGVIDVKSGPESSVATTKGFESVLYSLSLLGVQMSQFRGDPKLDAERKAYVQNLWEVVDHVYGLIVEPGKEDRNRVLDTREDVESLVNRVARAWKDRQKVLVIGSRNNPIYIEGELKAEEIAWLVGKAADIGDESWRNLLLRTADPKVPEAERVATIFNMTDPGRLDEFIRAIDEVTQAGIQVVVQTFAEDNRHLARLIQLQEQGKIDLVIVPRVRLTLQGLVDAPLYFRFSLALARAHGITDSQIDNSRNLAKSVVVSGARSREELIQASAARYVTTQEQAGQVEGSQASFRNYQRGLARAWPALQTPRQQSISRLPLLLNMALERWTGPEGVLVHPEDKTRAGQLLQRFSKAAGAPEPRARVVIVTDEEATQYAAGAAVGPFGWTEPVVSGVRSELYTKGVRVRIGGWYYRASYNSAEKRYTIRYAPDLNPYAQGKEPETKEVSVTQAVQTVSFNGREYIVDPSSFLPDPKEPEKLLSGLQLKATQPELLLSGIENIKVFRSTDRGIEDLVDEGTVVFLISRGRNRGPANAQLPQVAFPFKLRTGAEVPRQQDERSEERMISLAQRLRDRGVPLVTISDDVSGLRDSKFNPTRVAHLSLEADVDDVSVYPLTYLALLTVGARMGELLGRNTADFQNSLRTVPAMVAEVLADRVSAKRLEDLLRKLSQYRKVHIIGGGQAYEAAKELARVLSMLGIFAEAQLNDSAWHGPLAAVDPNKKKYSENTDDPAYRLKYGVNPKYPLDNDTLVLFVMTDSDFADSTNTDAQVYDSRNGRFLLVTLNDNVQKPGPGQTNLIRRSIIEAGPVKLAPITEEQVNNPELQDPEGIFAVPNATDALGNFNVAAFGAILAERFGHFRDEALEEGPQEPVSTFRPGPGPAIPPTGLIQVPADFLGERLRGAAFRQLPEGALGDLFEMGLGVFETNQPQVRMYPDSRNPQHAVIAIATWDRSGLLRDIGTVVSNAGLSIEDIVSDNYPQEPIEGRMRVAYELLDMRESVQRLQELGVADAIRTALAVPPVEAGVHTQFGSRLSDEEVEGIIEAYQGYSVLQSVPGQARVQTVVTEFPGDPQRSKMYVVADVRPAPGQLVQDVLTALQMEGTVGFAEAFQLNNQAPRVVLAVADVNTPMATLHQKGLDQEIKDRFQAGLEEKYDVVKAIKEAIAGSPFLQAVQQVVSGQWQSAVPPVQLSAAQISQMESQGNSAEDWSRVRVVPSTDLTKIRDNRFFGDVEIWSIGTGTAEVKPGVNLPLGIYDSTVINSRIGSNPLIYGNSVVSNQVVKENVIIVNGDVTASGKPTSFGLGTKIAVGPETVGVKGAGRIIRPFADMLLDAAARLATSGVNEGLLAKYNGVEPAQIPAADRDAVVRSREHQALQADYNAAHAQYVAAAASPVGIVEKGARIVNSRDVSNVYVGEGAQIIGAAAVRDTTILSSNTEQTKITDGAIVESSVIQWGSSVESAAQVRESVLLEHSHAERGGFVTGSVLGPNTGVAEGEVTAALVGPFVGFHHQALLIAAVWPEGKGNIGYGANVGSNHTGKEPDQEILPGEGTFFGLSVDIKYPSNFSGSPYLLIATSVKTLPQTVAFPFALINTPGETLPGLAPAFNEIVPAWVLMDNLFAVKRNEGKYISRNKATRHQFDFRVFRQDTVDLMKDARARLQAVQGKPAPVSGYYLDTPQTWTPEGENQQPVTAPGIPGLGKNYMKTDADAVQLAIDAYSRFILHYALRGVYDRVDALAKAGQLAQVANLLTQASPDPAWEHQRQTLAQERPGITLRDALAEFVKLEEQAAKDIESSKAKDDFRGRKIIPDYAEIHPPAEQNAFVQDTWANFRGAPAQGGKPAIEGIQPRVIGPNGLVPQLQQAGLESITVLVPTEIFTPVLSTVAARTNISGSNVPTGLELMLERVSLPSADTASLSVGVMAGTLDGVKGLAIGAALSRVKTTDGQLLPVAFVVDTVQEKAKLIEMGFSENSIFRIGDTAANTPNRDSAIAAADFYLKQVYGVGQVEDVGVNRSVSGTLEQILLALFRIQLLPESLALWESFVDRATLALQA